MRGRGLGAIGGEGLNRAHLLARHTKFFCVEALQRYGVPEIFNTDQGSRFTAANFVAVRGRHKIRIGMDGRGAWRDNVLVERLWRLVKYDEVYLHA